MKAVFIDKYIIIVVDVPPLQLQPVSIDQIELQPSPLIILPSSQ